MKSRDLFALGGTLLIVAVAGSAWSQGVERGVSKVEVERSKSDSRVVDVFAKEDASNDESAGRFVITFADGTSRVVNGALGNVEWERDGEMVTGRIVAPAGNEVARVHGKVSASGMSGEFKDSAGRTGTWEWVGDVP